MIKATELQIGDFVLIDGTPRKVEAITKKKIGYHRKENEPRLYYARIRDVEPIEITEEVLVKSGFGEVDLDGLVLQYEQGKQLCLKLKDSLFENYTWFYAMHQSGGIWFMDFMGKVSSGIQNVNRTAIRSLHDLRCLIKATSGVNFEVKL